MKKITVGLFPLTYSDSPNHLVEAYTQKKVGFELEIADETSRHRILLPLVELKILQVQIETALKSYKDFTELPERPLRGM
jgi:hypothetical protein